ncbi:MAG TPA: amidohydrolase [Candidatus Binatia bacterium]|nr:amidohydrolase [Candidatus Binatia bacterium]
MTAAPRRTGEAADLVVRGRIATLAENAPGDSDDLGFIEAIAIRAGLVVAAGSRPDIDAVTGPATRVLELASDEVALPGLTDAHVHLADAAVAAAELHVDEADTLSTVLAAVERAGDRQANLETWIHGGGWDAGRWGRWPTADDLETVVPGRRVVLWSHDLHAVWVSRAALEVAGVRSGTPDPPGGVIRRTSDGEPSGVLHEDATGLVTALLPRPAADELDRLIEAHTRRLLAFGIVAVHDMAELEVDATLERGFASISRLAEAGRLPIRVHAGFRLAALDRAVEHGLRTGDPLADAGTGPVGSRARVGWLKLFADGTLGSRTAALLAPYEPEPERGEPPGGHAGILLAEPAELADATRRASAAGIATAIHAIGDRALQAAVDALEPVASRTDARPRVEHVQLADPIDLRRMAEADILASIQPADLAADAAKARRAWGGRTADSYPWRRLAEAGVRVAFGSDIPAGSDDPWPGIAMAVTRRGAGWPADESGYHPEEALSIGQALRAACVTAPAAASEGDRGRLAVGQRADLVVISAAGLEDPDAFREVIPRLVLVDGSVAYEG